MSSAASWSLTEADQSAILDVLRRFLADSGARCALVVDRSGQMVASTGDRLPSDMIAFASLAAADFSANDQLARLIGERDFNTLFHQGERESMLLADVARRVILIALFDGRTTLGMVRLKMKTSVEQLGKVFTDVFSRPSGMTQTGGSLLGDVDDEIDRLFR